MNLQVTEGLAVAIIPDSNHEFLMSSKDVAVGYGVSEGNVRNQLHRNKDEFREGKHFGTAVCFSNSELQSVHWTKRGIVRLGFFIKSERARLFRDWAEDLIIEKVEQRQHKKSFAEHSQALKEKYVELPEYQQTVELAEQAVVVCGSAAQLARRLGMNPAVISLLRKHPWLVSDDNLRAVERGCRNLLSRDGKTDTETLEQLLQIEDSILRMSLYKKMQKGGLI